MNFAAGPYAGPYSLASAIMSSSDSEDSSSSASSSKGARTLSQLKRRGAPKRPRGAAKVGESSSHAIPSAEAFEASDDENEESSTESDSSSDEDSDSSVSDVAAEQTSTSKPQKIRRAQNLHESLSPSEDVPALSHAERRRQRKRQLKEQDDDEKPSSKKQKLDNGTASAVSSSSAVSKSKGKRDPTADQGYGGRQHSVWVGNMSFKTTTDDLKRFFAEVGEVTRINMPMKLAVQEKGAWAGSGKGENRGFAYVDFSSAEAKKAAIAKSEQPLLGRKLLIKDGDDFAGRPATSPADKEGATGSQSRSKTAQKILKVQKQPPAPTLFLGNLGFETTMEDIRQLFEAHRGTKEKRPDASKAEETDATKTDPKRDQKKDAWIKKVRMGTFEDSGLCKGFAFVDFVSIEEATNSLINPRNHLLNGRKLVVEYASPDAVRRGASKPKPIGDSRSVVAKSAREGKSTKSPEKQNNTDAGQLVDTPAADGHSRGERNPDPAKERKRADAGRKKWDPKQSKQRPRPGAALALAKRESAAIIPSQGKKITF